MRTAALLLLIFTGCPKKMTDSLNHPAAVAADRILTVLHTGSPEDMVPLLNATNRSKVPPEAMGEMMAYLRKKVGDARRVTEVRDRGSRGQTVAKVRVVEGEVIVITLTEEDGQFLLEDVNSPSVASYEALERLAP